MASKSRNATSRLPPRRSLCRGRFSNKIRHAAAKAELCIHSTIVTESASPQAHHCDVAPRLPAACKPLRICHLRCHGPRYAPGLLLRCTVEYLDDPQATRFQIRSAHGNETLKTQCDLNSLPVISGCCGCANFEWRATTLEHNNAGKNSSRNRLIRTVLDSGPGMHPPVATSSTRRGQEPA